MNSSQDTFLVAAGQRLEDLRGLLMCLSAIPVSARSTSQNFCRGNWTDERSSMHIAPVACSCALKGNIPLTWEELVCSCPD